MCAEGVRGWGGGGGVVLEYLKKKKMEVKKERESGAVRDGSDTE